MGRQKKGETENKINTTLINKGKKEKTKQRDLSKHHRKIKEQEYNI